MKYFILSLILLGCSSEMPKKKPIIYSKENPEVNTTNPKTPSIAAKQIAGEMGSNLVTELRFNKDGSKLNNHHREELKKLFNKARSQKLQSVQIISWSDQDYPSKNKSLSPEEVKLADNRAKVVEDYLKNLSKEAQIKKINMAQRDDKSETKKSLEIQKLDEDRASLVMVILVPEST